MGSGTGRWLRGILGRPSGVVFELGCIGEVFSKVQLMLMWENIFNGLAFSRPTVMDPITVGKATCQAESPPPPRPCQRAGRLNPGQIHKKDCAYRARELGDYRIAKEVNKAFYKESDLHYRLFCMIRVENRLRRGTG